MRGSLVPARALLEASTYSTEVSVLDRHLKGLRQGSTYLFYGDESPEERPSSQHNMQYIRQAQLADKLAKLAVRSGIGLVR